MLAEAESCACSELAETEKSAVRAQLERLLSTTHFSLSRRYPSLLRFLIEGALAGSSDLLKERTIGIEIFGKPADYDTGADPIVRVTAAEIRKRIALYYMEPGHENELRIEIPRGTYVPRFYWPRWESIPEAQEPFSVALPETIEVPTARRSSFQWWRLFAMLALAFLLSAACVAILRPARLSSFRFFWLPVLSGGKPLLFCVADQDQYSTIGLRDAADPSHRVLLNERLTAVMLEDMSPVIKIERLLESHGARVNLLAADATSLSDLRNGPTIFIGSFDNPWTLRLTRSLRYRFFNNPKMTQFGILDSRTPNETHWVVNRQQQIATNNYRDFALVARFIDSTTGRLTVVAAGVARGGTIIAGDFLTNSRDLAELERLAPNRNLRNMEVVLSTQIVDGNPGAPRIEDAYFW